MDFQILARATVLIVKPAQLDLGGVANGFAVDHAIQALKAHGAHCGQVNAGGDSRAIGVVKLPCTISRWRSAILRRWPRRRH